jgi:hypothetical protein
MSINTDFPMLAVHLRDINAGIVKAWEQAFADVPKVHVSRGDIFELQADAIVSPANSFGFMDGGIDLLYSKYFGWGLQTDLQALLADPALWRTTGRASGRHGHRPRLHTLPDQCADDAHTCGHKRDG